MKQLIKNSIYSLIDFLTLGKGITRLINGIRIVFPAKWSRYFESDYESENVTFLKANCKNGMTVIDIGAHLGLMSVTIAHLVGKQGKVYSFEPTPITYNTLIKIVKLNNFSEIIECINEAVSDVDGEINFFISETEGSNANSMVNRPENKRTGVKIKTITIDSFIKKKNITKIDIIKIDAEGVEYSVLKGAKQTLKNIKPKLILAIHPALIINNKNSLSEIFDLITELNYRTEYKNKVLDKKQFCSKEDFFDVHLFPNT